MKKKVYQDCLVEVMEMIRWEFEGSDQAHVIKDLDDRKEDEEALCRV